MLVMIAESVSSGLRGELSRWLIEVSPGVFVGSINALIRDQLWDLATQKAGIGGITQIFAAKNEQGYSIRQFGLTSRKIIDFDGLIFVKMLKS